MKSVVDLYKVPESTLKIGNVVYYLHNRFSVDKCLRLLGLAQLYYTDVLALANRLRNLKRLQTMSRKTAFINWCETLLPWPHTSISSYRIFCN